MTPTPSVQPRLSLDGFQGSSIVVLRRGGLGNQLFQHAAALGVSMATGGNVVYARSDETIRRHAIQLEDFVGTLPKASSADLARFLWPADWLPRRLLRDYRKLRWSLRIGRPLWRPPQSYMEQVERSFWGRSLLLDGFFQTPDWFAAGLPRVVMQVMERCPPDARPREDVIAVHVRAGRDFRQLGWCLPWEYYRTAIERIDPQRTAVVWPITDERDAEEDIRRRLEAAGWRVEQPDRFTGRKERDDFWNLARARCMVISKSTFAWWAAVVGDSIWPSGARQIICPASPPEGFSFPVPVQTGWLSLPVPSSSRMQG